LNPAARKAIVTYWLITRDARSSSWRRLLSRVRAS
jgi:hypothetical protein